MTFEQLTDAIAFAVLMAFCIGGVVGGAAATFFIKRDMNRD